ncbi:MAG: TonB-dependent receptor domain-containing protein [Bacteroidales bacterium]
MTKRLIFLLFMISAGFVLSAQRPGMRGSMPADGVVTGKVVEFATGNPMEYANVVLFSKRDSSIVSGTVTTGNGTFRITEVPYGRYYLVANFIGFYRETIDSLMINPRSKVVDVGAVRLHSATESLEAVEISAQKEHIEYKIDKKVVNVDQDIMAQGGTAVTALENTPSVQVDIDGNVSLRGSSSFTVLIDGRPTVLEGSDALQQIPASAINKIEIITNPSAKYDPDGVAGIINVVMKEKIERGFNGIINASAGTNEGYGLDFLLNYRYNKFNFFVGSDYNRRAMEGQRESRQITYQDTTEYRNSFGERDRARSGYGLRVGADYYLSDMTTLSVMGRLGNYSFGGTGTSNLHVTTDPFTSDMYSLTLNERERSGNYISGTVNFQQKFDDFGHKLDAMFHYSTRDGGDWDEQREFDTDADWNPIEEEPFFIRTTEEDADEEYRLKLDYTKPIGEEGKIEAGFQSRMEQETEKYIYRDWDYLVNNWVEDTLYSNNMDFRRDIHSIYGIYNNTFGSFGMQAGLRGEYTFREIKNMKATEPSLIDRWDYFPTLHASYSFKNKDQMLASYTRRIDRPRGWFLDPFISYMDQYNYRQGNPNLQPEYIDSYELGYQKRIWNSLISLEGYYRVTKNKVERIRTLQPDGRFLHTFENLGKDYALGVELMVNADPFKWLNLSLTGNLYNYRIEGNIAEEDVDNESTNWNSRLNAVIKLPAGFRMQLNGMYFGPSVRAQGESEGFFMTNLAVKKDFFDGKFSATVSARDLFNTGKHEFTSTGPGFYSYDYFDREAPIITLNLSWRINDYKRQMERNGNDMDNGGGMDDDF